VSPVHRLELTVLWSLLTHTLYGDGGDSGDDRHRGGHNDGHSDGHSDGSGNGNGDGDGNSDSETATMRTVAAWRVATVMGTQRPTVPYWFDTNASAELRGQNHLTMASPSLSQGSPTQVPRFRSKSPVFDQDHTPRFYTDHTHTLNTHPPRYIPGFGARVFPG
jgi:hypothetical protein